MSRYARNVDKRRSLPIHGYVGVNGSGKTLAAVADTIPSLLAGRPVLSSVPFVDPATGDPHPNWIPLVRWDQVVAFEGGDLVLDEVQGILSSRGTQSTHHAVISAILKMRHRDVAIRWTSPSYQRADVALREVTRGVTLCRGYWSKTVPDTLWRRNRLMLWRTYDGDDMEDFHARQVKSESNHAVQPRKLNGQWYRIREEPTDVETAPHLWYASDGEVLSVSDVTIAGTCLHCGGRRQRPKCECDNRAQAPAEHGWRLPPDQYADALAAAFPHRAPDPRHEASGAHEDDAASDLLQPPEGSTDQLHDCAAPTGDEKISSLV